MRAALGLLVLLWATGAQARTIGEKAIENHIRPVFEQLAGATGHLRQATAAYCDAPKGDRAALDAAFKDAVRAWAGAEHLRFGPVMKENRYERFAFWPDPKGLGLKQLGVILRDKDSSATKVETLRNKSVALQGLTAFEALFWSAEAEKSAATPEGREFICVFAKAIAGNLAEIAAAVRSEWASNDGFAANMIAPGPDKVYREEKEVVLELFNAFRTGLLQTRHAKLNRVLMGNPGEAQPRRAAFWRSGNSIVVITANVDALKDLYEKTGLYELVRDMGEGVERSTSDQFHLIDEALDALSGKPIADITASPNDWQKLNSVVFGLMNVQKTGGNAIAEAAKLPMSFNALDGD